MVASLPLPKFTSLRRKRRNGTALDATGQSGGAILPVTSSSPLEPHPQQTYANPDTNTSSQIHSPHLRDTNEKLSTDNKSNKMPLFMSKRRTALIWLSILLLVVGLVFLILTQLAQTSVSLLPTTHFITIDLTHIFLTPNSLPTDITFLNSIARSIGLHDYYTVGLWTFCSGYTDTGIDVCSRPKAGYWFNPVEIIMSELLSGAQIPLPADIQNILNLVKLASRVMFALFLTGTIFAFLYLLTLAPTLRRHYNWRPETRSCWLGFSIGILGFFAALFTIAASVVATVLFVIMRNVLLSQADLNIGAELGSRMFGFMWTGSGAVLIAWVLQWRCGCCFLKVRAEQRVRRENKRWEGDMEALGHRRQQDYEMRRSERGLEGSTLRGSPPRFGELAGDGAERRSDITMVDEQAQAKARKAGRKGGARVTPVPGDPANGSPVPRRRSSQVL